MQGAAAPRRAHLGPAGRVLEHVVGLGPQLVLDRLRARPDRRQRVGVGLDPLAQGVGGVPQLLAGELDGDEGRRAGGRAREGGHVDAGARAARPPRRRAAAPLRPGRAAARRSWTRR